MMNDESQKQNANGEFQVGDMTWSKRFAVAFRGMRVAFTQEKSFIGHFGIAAAVIVAGYFLGISKMEWCIVVLCMMTGLSTELLNTAVERLSKVVTREYHPDIRDTLDIASGAVMIITLGATVLAAIILGGALWRVAFS